MGYWIESKAAEPQEPQVPQCYRAGLGLVMADRVGGVGICFLYHGMSTVTACSLHGQYPSLAWRRSFGYVDTIRLVINRRKYTWTKLASV